MNSIGGVLQRAKESKLLANLDAEVWLAHLLDKDRIYLIKNPSEILEGGVLDGFWDGVKRMEVGKPLAQLTGTKEFYGMGFVINEHVLIPRPESELLVDLTKEYLKKRKSDDFVTVVDIGTGSGCILLAILKECAGVEGVGTEMSGQALEVAKKNSQIHGLEERVTWIEGDLMEQVTDKCEIIVANLPYIGTKKFNFIASNVAEFEPDIALYGGKDGLDLYRRMFQQLAEKDWQPGLIVGEFGFGQHEEMEKLLNQYYNGEDFRIIPDLAGIPRVFVIDSAS